ncbi:hypothetical protein [Enterococcus sp. AZ109]|uniref:hypothetical protein n=1 Tax=Enterococcus sp. AZ109 TaxID=2774634 RepID=UPI003F6822A0
MTIREYEIRMKAFRLRQVDEQYVIHSQAWANAMAQATKKGKPIYTRFEKFFDYKKAVKRATEDLSATESDRDQLQRFIANYNGKGGN